MIGTASFLLSAARSWTSQPERRCLRLGPTPPPSRAAANGHGSRSPVGLTPILGTFGGNFVPFIGVAVKNRCVPASLGSAEGTESLAVEA